VSNDNVTKLIQPGVFNDQLTEILRNGLAQACRISEQTNVSFSVSGRNTISRLWQRSVGPCVNLATHTKIVCPFFVRSQELTMSVRHTP
jgi:hypothetical protein